MHKLIFSLMTVFMTLIINGCGTAQLSTQEQELLGKTVYTQVAIWAENGKSIATNYQEGFLIPVNSAVEIQNVTANEILFKYNDQLIIVKNVKFTQIKTNQLLTRSFGKNKVNLSKFDKTTQENISNGVVVIGMSKEAVILARGYPPAHKTPFLEIATWKYWKTKFNTIDYQFIDNKVSKIVD